MIHVAMPTHTTSYDLSTPDLLQALIDHSDSSLDVVKQWLDSISQSHPKMVDARNKEDDGETALHLAAQCNNFEAAKLLLDAGAGNNLHENIASRLWESFPHRIIVIVDESHNNLYM